MASVSNSRLTASPSLLRANTSWAQKVVEPLDHFQRHQWPATVLPNNYLFYLRSEEKRMRARGISSSLHNSYEFVVGLKGEGNVCLKDKIYRITPGTAFLVKPGEFHYYFGFGSKAFAWLLFKFDLCEEASHQLISKTAHILSEDDMCRLQEIGQAYLQIRSDVDCYKIAAQMGELLQALNCRQTVEALGTLREPEFKSCHLLHQIAHFVLNTVDQAIRIRDIADFLQVSESNLRKVFREEFKISLGSYLRNTRFSRGVQLLRETPMSISEIAQRSGFESVASFSQAFRKGFGLTPSSYRQKFSSPSAEDLQKAP